MITKMMTSFAAATASLTRKHVVIKSAVVIDVTDAQRILPNLLKTSTVAKSHTWKPHACAAKQRRARASLINNCSQ